MILLPAAKHQYPERKISVAGLMTSQTTYFHLPLLFVCRQPCYQLDHICSPQEACTRCHLHIDQSHSTTA